MDKFKLAIEGGAFSAASPNAVAVFAIICEYGECPPIKDVGNMLGMLPSRVSASIADLKRRRLLDDEYKPLPFENIHLDSVKRPVKDVVQTVKERMANQRNSSLNAILTEEAAPSFNKKKRHSSGKAYKLFKQAFQEEFKVPYTLSAKAGSVYCKRLLTWVNDDLDLFVDIATFYFKNWEKIKENFGVRGKLPTLNLMATGSFFGRLRDTMHTGFNAERTLLNRYKEDDSPEAGF